MPEDDAKYCSKCKHAYKTILDTCVYCNGKLKPVQSEQICNDMFFVLFSFVVILAFVLVSSFPRV